MKSKRICSIMALICASMMMFSVVAAVAPVGSNAIYNITESGSVTVKTEPVNQKTALDDTSTDVKVSPDEIVTIIVICDDDPVLEKSGAIKENSNGSKSLTTKGERIKNSLVVKQNTVVKNIEKNVLNGDKTKVVYNFTLGMNAVCIEAPYGALDEINALDGVKCAMVSTEFDAPETLDGQSFLSPQMYSAGNMSGANVAWDNDYDGSGTLIAIIDTGLYTEHEAFSNAPDVLKYNLDDMRKIFEENDLNVKKSIADATGDMAYLSDKIPFAFDYGNKDFDVNHGNNEKANDHGTHVAGIAAADPHTDMDSFEGYMARGVAYQAQLAIMKVFGDTGGGASWANIIAALEDCVYLGVDAANVSIGAVSNFPTLESEEYNAYIDRLAENGVNLSVSAGNYFSTGYSSTWGTTMNTTWNLETGMMTSPASYRESLSVASIDNNFAYNTEYLQIGNACVLYYDSAPELGFGDLQFSKALGGSEYEAVIIPGGGSEEDFAKVDAAGKIAIVERGYGVMFQEKSVNAANAGAIGCIIYDNVVGTQLISLQIADFRIPTIYVPRLGGLDIVDEINSGNNMMFVSDGSPALTPSANGSKPSAFSSWGALCDLTIKPEIAAPGGNIMSTVDKNLSGKGENYYATMSGTSMAAPHIAGSIAIIRQRINELFPDMSREDKVNLAYSILMTTATPTVNDENVPYSVRKQGAGMVNLAAATATEAYITVDGQRHPKLELYDDPTRSGVYTLKFNVTSFSDDTLSYNIKPILTTNGYEWTTQGERAAYLLTDDNIDLSHMMTYTTNHDGNKITLAPGETKQVEVVMTVNDEFRELMAEVYPYGGYVEGYCFLETEADAEGAVAPTLSVCYLGYYGSWNELPVIDSGYYYDKPENQLGMMEVPNTMGSKFSSKVFLEFGINPYIESDDFEYLSDRNSMSPLNEDDRYDDISYVVTGVVRSLKSFYYKVYDKNSGEVYHEQSYDGEIDKNCDGLMGTFGGSIVPYGVSLNKMKRIKGEDYSEGTTLMVRAGGVPYHDGWDESESSVHYWELPITVDNTAPEIVETWSAGTKLYIKVTDNHYAAYVGVYDDVNSEPFAQYAIAENERGAETVIEIEMGDRTNAVILLGDYACNERQYEVNGDETSEQTSYGKTAAFTEGNTYIITSDDRNVGNNGDIYALSGATAQPYSIRLQGVLLDDADGAVIRGDRYDGIEWVYSNGRLQNVLSGKYLDVVKYGESYWLGTSETGTEWSYDGKTMTHNSSLTDNNTLVYYTTIAGNQSAAFDIMKDADNPISIYEKHTVDKDGVVYLTAELTERDGGVYADIDISQSSEAISSGIMVLSYNSNQMGYDSYTAGDWLSGGSVMVNPEVGGRVTAAFNNTSGFDVNGGDMMSIAFNGKAEPGSLIVVELVCTELLGMSGNDIDNITTSAAMISGSEPTPTDAPAPTGEPNPTDVPAPTEGVESPKPTAPVVPGTGADREVTLPVILAVIGFIGMVYFTVRVKRLEM